MDDDTLARLARLEAIESARDVVHRYADAVDRADLEVLSGLFSADATLTSASGIRVGRPQIVDFYRRHFADHPRRGRHFVTNVTVNEASVAAVSCSSYFLFTTASGDESVIGWGAYTDTICSEGGTWRLTAKGIAVAFRGPLRDGWAQLP